MKGIKKNNIKTLPSYVSPFAKKDLYHDIYHINYNKIAGLETYPGKYNILITDNKIYPSVKKKPYLHFNTENKKFGSGYMTSQEIFDEIISLSNKHKISDEGAEELIRVGKEVKEIASHLKNKLRDTGTPVLGTFIFRQPNDKKNKTYNKGFKNLIE